MALVRALCEGAASELEVLWVSDTNWSGTDDALRVLGQMKAPKSKTLNMIVVKPPRTQCRTKQRDVSNTALAHS